MPLDWFGYLVIDEQLSGRVQALEQHQLIGLLGNGVGDGGSDASFCGPEPKAKGEGP